MIGFVGLGTMGLPIVKNILKARKELSFYARRDAVIQETRSMGGQFCPSMEELGAKCDVVIFFLNTAEQCRECLEKLLAGMQAGTVIIGSTMSPKDCAGLAAICAQKGIILLDAPVSGGAQGAIDGTLTSMVSGDLETFEQHRNLLELYSKKIAYVGEKPGMAQTLKAINQQLVGINVVSVCEAYALGIGCGIDPQAIADTIPFCAGTSRIFENRSQYIIQRNFDKRSSLQIQLKDLKICRQLAKTAGITLPVTVACEKIYEEALTFCDPSEDSIAVLKTYER